MAEASTKMLLMLTSLVLLLSFKDLIFIHTRDSSPDAAAADQSVKAGVDEDVLRAADASFNSDGSRLDSDEYQEMLDEEGRKIVKRASEYDEDNEERERNNDEDEEEGFVDSNVGGNDAKKIPSLKMMKNPIGLQTLKFKFCYSCGYRNAFEQYSQIIQARYPEIKIVGENFTPVAWKLYLAQFLSTAKMILIGCIMFSYNPFTQFNMATPAVFNWALQNKFYASIMLFFLSNSFETHLISTGAFEIYLNDIQIWSKLASDRMPHEKELMQILDTNFNFESEKNAAFGYSSTNKF